MVTSIFNSFLSYLVIYDMIRVGKKIIYIITKTLQSRYFGEITMAKMRLWPGTSSPHTTPYPTRRLRCSLLGVRLGSPDFASVVQSKKSLNYTSLFTIMVAQLFYASHKPIFTI